MPITITGGKYSGSVTTVGAVTRLINSSGGFVQSDFSVPRIVGLWNSTGATYKGFAYIRRWISATELEIEQAFFDRDGATVSQIVGDTYLVSKNFADSVTVGIAISNTLVTITDAITFGTAGLSNSVCFYDENKLITANVGNNRVFTFSGGFCVFGHLTSYSDRVFYGSCTLRIQSIGAGATGQEGDQLICNNLAAKLIWCGGAILSEQFPSRLIGNNSGTAATPAEFQLWIGLNTNCDICSPNNGSLWSSNAANQRMINLNSAVSGNNSICLRWANGFIEGGNFKLIGSLPLSIFGSDSAGNYNISAPAGKFLNVSDGGTFASQALWRSGGASNTIQSVNYTNLVTIIRKHGLGLTPGSTPATNTTASFRFSGFYNGLQNGTLAIVKGNNLTFAIVDSNIVSDGTSTLTIQEAVVVGHTETVTENSWRYAFLRYGYTLVSGTFLTELISLGAAGNAKRVLFGGFVGQVLDTNINVFNSSIVAAYAAITTLNELYDRAQLWKTESTANSLYPALQSPAITADGSTLIAVESNWRFDATAASTFAINTSTSLITIKLNNLAGTSKFSAIRVSSGRSLTFAQSGNYLGFNIEAVSGSAIHFEQGGTTALAGIFASGSTITVAVGQTLIVTVPAGQQNNITAGTGVTIQSPPAIVSAPNLISGTRVQLYNLTDGIELDNTVLSSNGYTYSLQYTSNKILRLKAIYVNGATAKDYIEVTGTLTQSGTLFLVTQSNNIFYNQIAVDGSTVSEFIPNGMNVDINNSNLNSSSLQRAYSKYIYYLSTETGIRIYGNNVLPQSDIFNFLVNASLTFRLLDTTKPFSLTGGVIKRTDGLSVINPGSAITIEPDRVYSIATSGGSSGGLTSDQIAALNRIDNRVDVAVSTRSSGNFPTVPTAAANAAAVRAELVTELTRINAPIADRPTLAQIEASTVLAKVANLPVAPDNNSIAAIKLKTDNLPTNPASTSDVQNINPPSASAIRTEIENSMVLAKTNQLPPAPNNTAIDAIKAKTDLIPTNPLLTTDTRLNKLNNLDVTISSRSTPADLQVTVSGGFTTADRILLENLPILSEIIGILPPEINNSEIAAEVNSVLLPRFSEIKTKTDCIPTNPAAVSDVQITVSGGFTSANSTKLAEIYKTLYLDSSVEFEATETEISASDGSMIWEIRSNVSNTGKIIKRVQ